MKRYLNLGRNELIAIGAALVVVVAGVLVLRIQAAGFFASAAPEDGTKSGQVSVKTDAVAAGGKYISFGSASTSPTPPSGSLWLPTAAQPIAFHWVLGGSIDINDPVQMGLRDMNDKQKVLPEPDVYDIDGEYNTKQTVDYLHSKGKKVICYFDAGVYEDYRGDAWKFKALQPQVWGAVDDGWEGSYWLDIRRVSELEPIMKARIQMCKDKGFDSIEPDEITNWSNNPGFDKIEVNGHKGITYQDQIIYNRAVAKWAHEAGLSIGLKGDLEQAHDLVNDFDWTLNEECFQYDECTTITNEGPGADGKDYPGLQLFAQKNKAVWVAEYQKFDAAKWNSICSVSKTQHFNTTLFKLGLPTSGGRTPCPTTSTTSW